MIRLRSGVRWERLYVMRAADALASAVASYAVPLLVLLATGSAGLTGMAFAAEWAPRLVAFGLAGACADRFGAHRVFRLANAVRAAVAVTVAGVLSVVGGSEGRFVAVSVFGVVSGLLSEFGYVACETLGSEAARREEGAAHRVQAVLTGIDQGAALAGPVLGALALVAGPVLLLGGFAALAVLAAAVTPVVPAPAVSTSVSGKSGVRSGWRVLRSAPALLWLTGGLAVSNFATGVVQAAAPVTVVVGFGESAAQVGAVWSGAAVASLGAVWGAQRAVSRWGVWPVGVVSAAVCSAGCLGAAASSSFVVYAVAVAVLMTAEGALTVVLRTLRASLIPVDGFASTLSASILLVTVPLPFCGVLVGAVPAHRLGAVVGVCALVQGLALAGAFGRLRRALVPSGA
ncbi:MFS transporter [Streptomyces acidiscabies]|uniref:MFS transporter n=1 Tax=Streptomyces acidiscabies TaxID=42234 RepID=A0AAP6BM18_9ACTN|nr:MFS transporter [Streptomyces acidiscabies]MBP5936704.1 MFS transporter [Streptomyces sp. LBUM 1476]MBZ3915298.1 MFS transporter [Streptomyces acidiscabies]MDX2967257.1 MFS transporter [Streptomyces acidiscabies]MDX3026059.1 MFS transporter [Streptomyces acidiscabies]MDX3797034.1 MFS transporter [Streptomyces acidiscabies]